MHWRLIIHPPMPTLTRLRRASGAQSLLRVPIASAHRANQRVGSRYAHIKKEKREHAFKDHAGKWIHNRFTGHPGDHLDEHRTLQ